MRFSHSPLGSVSRVASVAVLTALVALLSTASCGDETIVIAKLPVTDSGAPAPTPTACLDSSVCAAGYYCQLPECQPPAGTAGTCVALPEVCNEPYGPECGCDNVTYWSDCLRQKNGIAWYNKMEPCQNDPQDFGTPCGDGVPNSTPCVAPALCAELGSSMHGAPSDCDHVSPGTCWVLPDECPSTAVAHDQNLWDSCSPTGEKCVDTCNAIRNGGAYRESMLQCQ